MKINNMVKQVQQMQSQILKIQEQLANEQVEASVGGGMIKATFSGQGNLLAIDIDPEVIKPEDKDMLEDLVISAINEGIKKSHDLMSERMGGFTGALSSMGLGL